MTDPDDTVPDDAREFEASVEPFWDRKPWRRKFIDTLATTGNVTLACRESGIGRWTVYHDRRTDDAFRQAWERAMREAGDLLEQIAFRRATGYKRTTEKYVVDEKTGERVLVEVKVEDTVSDVVLLTLLRAAKPEKYRETVRMEHGGIGGEPILIEPVRVRTPERLAELLEIAEELRGAGLPVIEHKQLEPGENGANGTGE